METKISEIESLMGFVQLVAKFRNNNEEAVSVRELPVRELPKYIDLAGDEAGTIELCCGKEKGWADKLTDASHLELLEAANKANFTRATAWAERQLAAGNTLVPLLEKMVKHAESVSAVSRIGSRPKSS